MNDDFETCKDIARSFIASHLDLDGLGYFEHCKLIAYLYQLSCKEHIDILRYNKHEDFACELASIVEIIEAYTEDIERQWFLAYSILKYYTRVLLSHNIATNLYYKDKQGTEHVIGAFTISKDNDPSTIQFELFAYSPLMYVSLDSFESIDTED